MNIGIIIKTFGSHHQHFIFVYDKLGVCVYLEDRNTKLYTEMGCV